MKIDSTVSAVVTGGASGLGLASVKALRALGAKVAIFDLNPEAGAKVAEETGSVFCEANVMSEASLDVAFAKARAANGQERILISCAGGGNAKTTIRKDKETGEFLLFPTEEFARVLTLNAVGTFATVTRFAAGCATLDPVEGERGAIVCTGSIAAQDGLLRDYYAFTWGDALFVTIDPYWHADEMPESTLYNGDATSAKDIWNATMGDAQYAWLKQTLDQARREEQQRIREEFY